MKQREKEKEMRREKQGKAELSSTDILSLLPRPFPRVSLSLVVSIQALLAPSRPSSLFVPALPQKVSYSHSSPLVQSFSLPVALTFSDATGGRGGHPPRPRDSQTLSNHISPSLVAKCRKNSTHLGLDANAVKHKEQHKDDEITVINHEGEEHVDNHVAIPVEEQDHPYLPSHFLIEQHDDQRVKEQQYVSSDKYSPECVHGICL